MQNTIENSQQSWLTEEQLWALRREIQLNSLYLSDYNNTLGIDRNRVCDFFDSFLSYANELLEQEHPYVADKDYYRVLFSYDTLEHLWNWYQCYEENPLPLPIPEEEEEDWAA